MKATKILLDGNNITRDDASGILVTSCEWLTKRTYSDSKKYQGTHGRKRTPEIVEYRRITIEGVLDNLGNDYYQPGHEYLSQLLSIEGDTSEIIPRKLVIRDQFDRDWMMDVVVAEAVEFVPYDDSFSNYADKWRVVLESTDSPLYKSLDEVEITATKTEFGGFGFPISFPFSLKSFTGSVDFSSTGNVQTPLHITIIATTAITGPISIINLSNGQKFVIDVDANPGDIIIIDSEKNIATKNGINIIEHRQPGSQRMRVKGFTQLQMFDANPDVDSDFEIVIRFRNSML